MLGVMGDCLAFMVIGGWGGIFSRIIQRRPLNNYYVFFFKMIAFWNILLHKFQ